MLTLTDHPGAPVLPFSTDHFVSAPLTRAGVDVDGRGEVTPVDAR